LDFVVVRFKGKEGNENRKVIVDGQSVGETDAVIAIESGTHEFSLGGDDDYQPKNVLKMLYDTSSSTPLEIEFHST